MSILFGHPTGNPNSHQAALAHFETGRLEAFCVPWMPSARTLRLLNELSFSSAMVSRLSRRYSPPLAKAPTVQGRIGEMRRLLVRALGRGDEGLSYDANDWLMRTMRRESRRANVTAVHAYEDCSLWQFDEAKRQGKACIYDMPIGYYFAWDQTQTELAREYADWLPANGLPSKRYVREEQKRKEMDLADLVLAPSAFVADTVRRFHPEKRIEIAGYGMDTVTDSGPLTRAPKDEITFLFVGQCSLRKGTPLLLEAWRAAKLDRARLRLIGSWQLAQARQKNLPPRTEWLPPVPRAQLRDHYNAADVFVFPTYFEGQALVIGEALASGLPVLTTPAAGADDVIDDTCGRLMPVGNFDALVEGLRWFAKNRDQLPSLSLAARGCAGQRTWRQYRSLVSKAVSPFV